MHFWKKKQEFTSTKQDVYIFLLFNMDFYKKNFKHINC